jgi:hypothetical protein
MVEEASTSETSVNVYQTTRRYNPKDSQLHIPRREDLKSYRAFVIQILNFWCCLYWTGDLY